MTDLYLGALINFVITIVLFYLARSFLKNKTSRHQIIWVSGAFVVFLAYLYFLHHSVLWAQLFPFSNILVLGNAIPPLLFLFCGFVYEQMPPRRRYFYLLLFFGFSVYSSLIFFLNPSSSLFDYDKEGVQLQSTPVNCAPASAATLLQYYGIESKEQEMINLCLTSTKGTPLYGIYRGLSLKTKQTPWKTEIFSVDLPTLKKFVEEGPCLIVVGLKASTKIDPDFEKKWGWIPGTTHIVVVFKFLDDDKIEVGDPAIGRENWDLRALDILWAGEGLRLVK